MTSGNRGYQNSATEFRGVAEWKATRDSPAGRLCLWVANHYQPSRTSRFLAGD